MRGWLYAGLGDSGRTTCACAIALKEPKKGVCQLLRWE